MPGTIPIGLVTRHKDITMQRIQHLAELTGLAQTLARRVGRFLERQGLLERDAETSYLPTQSGPIGRSQGAT